MLLFQKVQTYFGGINGYAEKISNQFSDTISSAELEKMKLPDEIKSSIQNSGQEVVQMTSSWIKNSLTGILNFVTSVPSMCIYIIIGILALYFICTDKIYIIDQMEHHFPESWVRKLSKHIKEILSSLGDYLKAEAILILISFVICLIGLSILKIVGLNIPYPFLSALGIGFIDALPILRFICSNDTMGNNFSV